MKYLFSLIPSFLLFFAALSIAATPALAIEYNGLPAENNRTDTTITIESDLASNEEVTAAFLGSIAFISSFFLIFLFLGLGTYIFYALALMTLAKRLDYDNSWFAWIPILNIALLFKIGDMNPLFVLLILVPGVGGLLITVITVIAMMNICEKRGYEKLLGLLNLVPIANIILIGVLAWGENNTKPSHQTQDNITTDNSQPINTMPSPEQEQQTIPTEDREIS